MKDLLRLEFRKLRTQKSFYIILAIMAAMLLITGITAEIVLRTMPEITEAAAASGEAIPSTFSSFLLGFSSASMFSMLTAIFVSIVVCGDYDSQIVKNIYSRGYSRKDHYFAQGVYAFVATTFMFLFAVIVSAAVGGAFFGFEGVTGKTFILLGGQYVVCMSGVALSFAVAAAIKKLGATIAVNIIVPMIVPLLFELADTALKIKDFKISDVWMSSFLTSLMNPDEVTGRIVACVIGAVVYAVVFIAAGFAINKKTEV